MIDFWETISTVLTAQRKARWAKRFGKHQDTIGAWARPVESDENPTGSGKKSYFDHVAYLIRDIHKTHPVEARTLATAFAAIVDDLDERAGIASAIDETAISDHLSKVVKEHADLLLTLLGTHDRAKLERALNDIHATQSATNQLLACVETHLQRLEVRS